MSICGQRQGKDFLKKLFVKKVGELLSLAKPAKNNDRAANRTLPFERTFI
jgi:hypothetical protein